MIWNEKANTARVGERFMVSSVSELAGKLWAQKTISRLTSGTVAEVPKMFQKKSLQNELET